ncbi:condensation domain-containing protein [Nocardioides convexus]|uniref:condensation domain-containing protein n=1 Tax=Nocardioides convexus TaxID=2712224 RepID=UPI0024185C1C|nr:condensation domain-containing protein [Nocardioides convexus]
MLFRPTVPGLDENKAPARGGSARSRADRVRPRPGARGHPPRPGRLRRGRRAEHPARRAARGGLICRRTPVPPPDHQGEPCSRSVTPSRLIWLQHRIAPDSRAYYSTAVLNLHGPIDAALLRVCVVNAVRRHDAMRLRLCDVGAAVPRQEVVADVEVVVPEHDLRRVADPEQVRSDLLFHQMQDEFDLQTAPLARWSVLRLDEEEWRAC